MTTPTVGTIVFTDLVGFTQFNDVSGDQAAVDVLDHQLAIMSDAIASHPGARVVKELGDGLMIWVPEPSDAITIARTFLADVEAARDLGTFPLAVRVGLHYGDVVTRNDDVVGRTVNVAARIVDLAGPGELLLSEEALSTSSSRGFEPVGPATIKGVTTPIWLYRTADPISA